MSRCGGAGGEQLIVGGEIRSRVLCWWWGAVARGDAEVRPGRCRVGFQQCRGSGDGGIESALCGGGFGVSEKLPARCRICCIEVAHDHVRHVAAKW